MLCSSALGDARTQAEPSRSLHLPRSRAAWMPGCTEGRKPVMVSPKEGCKPVPPATGHSRDAIKALQATLLAGHLAAKPQCLLHALSLRQAEDD